MTVELKEFITQTLSDILKGVIDAQDDASVGKNIAPSTIGGTHYPGSGIATVIRGGALVAVNFDVAVTAEASDAVKGGGGFKVAGRYKQNSYYSSDWSR